MAIVARKGRMVASTLGYRQSLANVSPFSFIIEAHPANKGDACEDVTLSLTDAETERLGRAIERWTKARKARAG